MFLCTHVDTVKKFHIMVGLNNRGFLADPTAADRASTGTI